MGITPIHPTLSTISSRANRIPGIVRCLFIADALVVLFAVLNEAWSRVTGREPLFFFRLSYESNFPTWFSSSQHLLVSGLFWVLAIREIRTDIRRIGIVLPALIFLTFSLDETAMLHERISQWMNRHTEVGQILHLTNSASGMLVCLPLAVSTVLLAAWSTRRYWEARPGVILKCLIGTGLILLSAGMLEILVNAFQDRPTLVRIESLLEECGEMFGSTISLWGAIELLAAERVSIHVDANGLYVATIPDPHNPSL